MEQSILISTKNILGLDQAYDAFDLDLITYINMAFATLNQMGVGPTEAFAIEGDKDMWDDISLTVHSLSMVRTYIFLKTRSLFDPPATSFAIAAMDKQIEELEWRLSVFREVETHG